jgi:hypothetical protein
MLVAVLAVRRPELAKICFLSVVNDWNVKQSSNRSPHPADSTSYRPVFDSESF